MQVTDSGEIQVANDG